MLNCHKNITLGVGCSVHRGGHGSTARLFGIAKAPAGRGGIRTQGWLPPSSVLFPHRSRLWWPREGPLDPLPSPRGSFHGLASNLTPFPWFLLMGTGGPRHCSIMDLWLSPGPASPAPLWLEELQEGTNGFPGSIVLPPLNLVGRPS